MNQKLIEKKIVDGILLLNKPQGLTSNAALQQVKRLLRAQKAGHTGSLDPLATGMLPLCFGEATKFSQYLLDADKCYEATGLLGIKTDTSDAMGQIIAQVADFSVSKTQLQTVLDTFLGTIQQVPSMFSALKHQGQPLYQLARKGIAVERKARDITIHALKLNAFDGREFKLTIICSKGTYIRNLVEDIGERLGVGAHVTQLHRVYTAGLESESMFSLDELTQKSSEELMQLLLPVDRSVNYLPTFILDAEQIIALRQGKTIQITQPTDSLNDVRLYSIDNEFIGLGQWETSTILKVKRLQSTHDRL